MAISLLLFLLRHILDEADLIFTVRSEIRPEQVMEPDRRLFRKRNRLIINYLVPWILTLLLAVHQTIAEGSDLMFLKQRKYGEVVRSTGPGHPLRAYHRPAVLLAVLHEQRAVRQ